MSFAQVDETQSSSNDAGVFAVAPGSPPESCTTGATARESSLAAAAATAAPAQPSFAGGSSGEGDDSAPSVVHPPPRRTGVCAATMGVAPPGGGMRRPRRPPARRPPSLLRGVSRSRSPSDASLPAAPDSPRRATTPRHPGYIPRRGPAEELEAQRYRRERARWTVDVTTPAWAVHDGDPGTSGIVHEVGDSYVVLNIPAALAWACVPPAALDAAAGDVPPHLEVVLEPLHLADEFDEPTPLPSRLASLHVASQKRPEPKLRNLASLFSAATRAKPTEPTVVPLHPLCPPGAPPPTPNNPVSGEALKYRASGVKRDFARRLSSHVSIRHPTQGGSTPPRSPRTPRSTPQPPPSAGRREKGMGDSQALIFSPVQTPMASQARAGAGAGASDGSPEFECLGGEGPTTPPSPAVGTPRTPRGRQRFREHYLGVNTEELEPGAPSNIDGSEASPSPWHSPSMPVGAAATHDGDAHTPTSPEVEAGMRRPASGGGVFVVPAGRGVRAGSRGDNSRRSPPRHDDGGGGGGTPVSSPASSPSRAGGSPVSPSRRKKKPFVVGISAPMPSLDAPLTGSPTRRRQGAGVLLAVGGIARHAYQARNRVRHGRSPRDPRGSPGMSFSHALSPFLMALDPEGKELLYVVRSLAPDTLYRIHVRRAKENPLLPRAFNVAPPEVLVLTRPRLALHRIVWAGMTSAKLSFVSLSRMHTAHGRRELARQVHAFAHAVHRRQQGRMAGRESAALPPPQHVVIGRGTYFNDIPVIQVRLTEAHRPQTAQTGVASTAPMAAVTGAGAGAGKGDAAAAAAAVGGGGTAAPPLPGVPQLVDLPFDGGSAALLSDLIPGVQYSVQCRTRSSCGVFSLWSPLARVATYSKTTADLWHYISRPASPMSPTADPDVVDETPVMATMMLLVHPHPYTLGTGGTAAAGSRAAVAAVPPVSGVRRWVVFAYLVESEMVSRQQQHSIQAIIQNVLASPRDITEGPFPNGGDSAAFLSLGILHSEIRFLQPAMSELKEWMLDTPVLHDFKFRQRWGTKTTFHAVLVPEEDGRFLYDCRTQVSRNVVDGREAAVRGRPSKAALAAWASEGRRALERQMRPERTLRSASTAHRGGKRSEKDKRLRRGRRSLASTANRSQASLLMGMSMRSRTQSNRSLARKSTMGSIRRRTTTTASQQRPPQASAAASPRESGGGAEPALLQLSLNDFPTLEDDHSHASSGAGGRPGVATAAPTSPASPAKAVGAVRTFGELSDDELMDMEEVEEFEDDEETLSSEEPLELNLRCITASEDCVKLGWNSLLPEGSEAQTNASDAIHEIRYRLTYSKRAKAQTYAPPQQKASQTAGTPRVEASPWGSRVGTPMDEFAPTLLGGPARTDTTADATPEPPVEEAEVTFKTAMSSWVVPGLTPGMEYTFRLHPFDEGLNVYHPPSDPCVACTLSPATLVLKNVAYGVISYHVYTDQALAGTFQVRIRAWARGDWADVDAEHGGWQGREDAESYHTYSSTHMLRYNCKVNHRYEFRARQGLPGSEWGQWSTDVIHVGFVSVRVEPSITADRGAIQVSWEPARTATTHHLRQVKAMLNVSSLSRRQKRSFELPAQALHRGLHTVTPGYDRYQMFMSAFCVYEKDTPLTVLDECLASAPTPKNAIATCIFLHKYAFVFSRIGETHAQGYLYQQDGLPNPAGTEQVLIGRGFPTLPELPSSQRTRAGGVGVETVQHLGDLDDHIEKDICKVLARIRSMNAEEHRLNTMFVSKIEVCSDRPGAKVVSHPINGYMGIIIPNLEQQQRYGLKVRVTFDLDGEEQMTEWSDVFEFRTQSALRLVKFFSGRDFVVASWYREFWLNGEWSTWGGDRDPAATGEEEHPNNNGFPETNESVEHWGQREWMVCAEATLPAKKKIPKVRPPNTSWDIFDAADQVYTTPQLVDHGGGTMHPYYHKLYCITTPYKIQVETAKRQVLHTEALPPERTSIILKGLFPDFSRRIIRLKQAPPHDNVRESRWVKLNVTPICDLKVVVHLIGETNVLFSVARNTNHLDVSMDTELCNNVWHSDRFTKALAAKIQLSEDGVAYVVRLVNADNDEQVCWRVFHPLMDFKSTFSQLATSSAYIVQVTVLTDEEHEPEWHSLARFSTLKPRGFRISGLTDCSTTVMWKDMDDMDLVIPNVGRSNLVDDGTKVATTWYLHRPSQGSNNVELLVRRNERYTSDSDAVNENLRLARKELIDSLTVTLNADMKGRDIHSLYPDTIYDVFVRKRVFGSNEQSCHYVLSFLTLPKMVVRVEAIGASFALLTASRESRSKRSQGAMSETLESQKAYLAAKEKLDRARRFNSHKIDFYEQQLEACHERIRSNQLISGQHKDMGHDIRVFLTSELDVSREIPQNAARLKEVVSPNGVSYRATSLTPGLSYTALVRGESAWGDDMAAPLGDEKWGAWGDPLHFETMHSITTRLEGVGESFFEVALHRAPLPGVQQNIPTTCELMLQVNADTTPRFSIAPGATLGLRLTDLDPDTTYVVNVKELMLQEDGADAEEWSAWSEALVCRTIPTRPSLPILYELNNQHMSFWWVRETLSNTVDPITKKCLTTKQKEEPHSYGFTNFNMDDVLQRCEELQKMTEVVPTCIEVSDAQVPVPDSMLMLPGVDSVPASPLAHAREGGFDPVGGSRGNSPPSGEDPGVQVQGARDAGGDDITDEEDEEADSDSDAGRGRKKKRRRRKGKVGGRGAKKQLPQGGGLLKQHHKLKSAAKLSKLQKMKSQGIVKGGAGGKQPQPKKGGAGGAAQRGPAGAKGAPPQASAAAGGLVWRRGGAAAGRAVGKAPPFVSPLQAAMASGAMQGVRGTPGRGTPGAAAASGAPGGFPMSPTSPLPSAMQTPLRGIGSPLTPLRSRLPWPQSPATAAQNTPLSQVQQQIQQQQQQRPLDTDGDDSPSPSPRSRADTSLDVGECVDVESDGTSGSGAGSDVADDAGGADDGDSRAFISPFALPDVGSPGKKRGKANQKKSHAKKCKDKNKKEKASPDKKRSPGGAKKKKSPGAAVVGKKKSPTKDAGNPAGTDADDDDHSAGGGDAAGVAPRHAARKKSPNRRGGRHAKKKAKKKVSPPKRRGTVVTGTSTSYSPEDVDGGPSRSASPSVQGEMVEPLAPPEADDLDGKPTVDGIAGGPAYDDDDEEAAVALRLCPPPVASPCGASVLDSEIMGEEVEGGKDTRTLTRARLGYHDAVQKSRSWIHLAWETPSLQSADAVNPDFMPISVTCPPYTEMREVLARNTPHEYEGYDSLSRAYQLNTRDASPQQYETIVQCAALPLHTEPFDAAHAPDLTWYTLGTVTGSFARLKLPKGIPVTSLAFRLQSQSMACLEYCRRYGQVVPRGSEYSAAVAWRPIGAPDAVTGLVVQSVTYKSARLHWIDSVSLRTHNQVHYTVLLQQAGSRDWDEVMKVRGTCAELDSLVMNSAYRVMVRTESCFGVGKTCPPVKFSTAITRSKTPVSANATNEELRQQMIHKQYLACRDDGSSADLRRGVFDDVISDVSAGSGPGLDLPMFAPQTVFTPLAALNKNYFPVSDVIPRSQWHWPYPAALFRDSIPPPEETPFHLFADDLRGRLAKQKVSTLSIPWMQLPTRFERIRPTVVVEAPAEADAHDDAEPAWLRALRRPRERLRSCIGRPYNPPEGYDQGVVVYDDEEGEEIDDIDDDPVDQLKEDIENFESSIAEKSPSLSAGSAPTPEDESILSPDESGDDFASMPSTPPPMHIESPPEPVQELPKRKTRVRFNFDLDVALHPDDARLEQQRKRQAEVESLLSLASTRESPSMSSDASPPGSPRSPTSPRSPRSPMHLPHAVGRGSPLTPSSDVHSTPTFAAASVSGTSLDGSLSDHPLPDAAGSGGPRTPEHTYSVDPRDAPTLKHHHPPLPPDVPLHAPAAPQLPVQQQLPPQATVHMAHAQQQQQHFGFAALRSRSSTPGLTPTPPLVGPVYNNPSFTAADWLYGAEAAAAVAPMRAPVPRTAGAARQELHVFTRGEREREREWAHPQHATRFGGIRDLPVPGGPGLGYGEADGDDDDDDDAAINVGGPYGRGDHRQHAGADADVDSVLDAPAGDPAPPPRASETVIIVSPDAVAATATAAEGADGTPSPVGISISVTPPPTHIPPRAQTASPYDATAIPLVPPSLAGTGTSSYSGGAGRTPGRRLNKQRGVWGGVPGAPTISPRASVIRKRVQTPPVGRAAERYYNKGRATPSSGLRRFSSRMGTSPYVRAARRRAGDDEEWDGSAAARAASAEPVLGGVWPGDVDIPLAGRGRASTTPTPEPGHRGSAMSGGGGGTMRAGTPHPSGARQSRTGSIRRAMQSMRMISVTPSPSPQPLGMEALDTSPFIPRPPASALDTGRGRIPPARTSTPHPHIPPDWEDDDERKFDYAVGFQPFHRASYGAMFEPDSVDIHDYARRPRGIPMQWDDDDNTPPPADGVEYQPPIFDMM